MLYNVKSIRTLNSKHSKELLELFAEADFAGLADGTQWLTDAVENSTAAVAAFDNNDRLIGFARALGDKVSDCYIQDVAVRKDYRRQGIGNALMALLLKILEEKNIDWVGLIATPGKAGFYRNLGFEEMTDHTPMRLKREKI